MITSPILYLSQAWSLFLSLQRSSADQERMIYCTDVITCSALKSYKENKALRFMIKNNPFLSFALRWLVYILYLAVIVGNVEISKIIVACSFNEIFLTFSKVLDCIKFARKQTAATFPFGLRRSLNGVTSAESSVNELQKKFFLSLWQNYVYFFRAHSLW